MTYKQYTKQVAKVKVDGKAVYYRLATSMIPDSERQYIDPILADYGYVDMVNALAPKSRNRYDQLFLKEDGTAELYDSRKAGEIGRRAASARRLTAN